jgi:hypothetical protein
MTHDDTRTHRRGLLMRGATGIAAVAAGTAAVLGLSAALFTATQTSDVNTFTAGTVSVGLGTESVTCEIAQIMPGDSSAGYPDGSNDLDTCVYDVRYTGDAPAWLAVDVLVEGGTPALFNAGADGLQLRLTANDTVEVVTNTSYTNASGAPTAIASGTVVDNLLVSTTPAEQGDAVVIDLDYLLPTIAPNALQGGTASVTLTFHAVQSDNQPIGSCVAGRQCDSIDWG